MGRKSDYGNGMYQQLMEIMEHLESVEKSLIKIEIFQNRLVTLKTWEGKNIGILVYDHGTALYHLGTYHGECNLLFIYLRKNAEGTRNYSSDEMIGLLGDKNRICRKFIEQSEYMRSAEMVAEYEQIYFILLKRGKECKLVRS